MGVEEDDGALTALAEHLQEILRKEARQSVQYLVWVQLVEILEVGIVPDALPAFGLTPQFVQVLDEVDRDTEDRSVPRELHQVREDLAF
ncbi:MAG: hypothetical protein ACRDQX_11210 [Pseudonocardiaceae bacterium]